MSQAQDGIKSLGEELRRRWANHSGLQSLPFVTGHAVAFPLTRLAKLNLPMSWQRELIFDCDDLARIGARLEATMSFWRRTAPRKKALSASEFKRFRKRVLFPTLDLVPSLGASLELDRQQLVRLSDEQLDTIEAFIDNRRINVVGGAGTGKTMLALEAACHLADQGARVLLLCFTRALADHLRELVHARTEPGESPLVTTFHALCFKAAAQLERTLEIPRARDAQREFWRVEAPMVLLEALEQDALRHFDALVVDEGQDFTDDWWDIVEGLLRDPETGHRVIFHDPDQSVFGREGKIPPAPTFKLTRNFRNTKTIAELLTKLSDTTAPPHRHAPEGEPPRLLPLPTSRDLVRQLEKQITHLVHEGVRPEDIALLTPHSKKNSSLADIECLGDYPIADINAGQSGALRHASISAFKGLEAEVVFLLDLTADDPRADRAARYVGASRARSLLFVFSKGRFDLMTT